MNSAKRIFPRLKATAEDNQVLFVTRLIAAIIVPILTIAFLMLYLLPKQSGILFAWPIKPSMTAMMLGAAYLGGAYYFTRVFLAKKWSRVKLGFLPVTAFASFLGIATILHWDKFTAGHPSFIMWAFLYIVLPFVLPVIWWLNRDADPQTLDTHDSYLPKNIERFFLVIGILLTFVSLILLIVPAVMISIWPWTISALTGRVLGAMFVLPGLVGIGIAQDKRWRSAQIILQSQIFSMGLILLAIVISRTDFDWAQLGAWVFALSFTLLFIALIAIYIMMTKRAR
ncbi:MAG: hypothetical protein CL607_06520 [Anaerolineaceae bacterium]|nr:hypothetical protein [Anaerolineaceae bacterium]